MKKAIKIMLSVAVVSCMCTMGVRVNAAPSVSAQSSVLMEVSTGEVLFEKNADSRSLIASTTKIMTAIVVIEHCEPDEIVLVGSESVGIEGSSMYLEAGKEYRVEDLLYGLMLASGNDAATALAVHCGGSVEGFAELMNEKADSLGMDSSNFVNPHGLDHEDHKSTARDLAVLMAHCMESERFCEIIGTQTHKVGELYYTNHNKLLTQYEHMIGGKTGYTRSSGRSLVTASEKDGVTLVCVTLGAPDDWNDHKKLFDWGFSRCESHKFGGDSVDFGVPVISGVSETVKVELVGTGEFVTIDGAEPEYTIELPQFVFAPVEQGECLGSVLVSVGGETLMNLELLASEYVAMDEGVMLSPFENFKRMWQISGKMWVSPYYLKEDEDERTIAETYSAVWTNVETSSGGGLKAGPRLY